MSDADRMVRNECRRVAREQQTGTNMVDPEGLASSKSTPGPVSDGWPDPKNVDERGCYEYGRRRMSEEDNVDEAATDGNPNNDMLMW